eukprot:jgi/Mesvir1/26546/Mv16201-RA.1
MKQGWSASLDDNGNVVFEIPEHGEDASSEGSTSRMGQMIGDDSDEDVDDTEEEDESVDVTKFVQELLSPNDKSHHSVSMGGNQFNITISMSDNKEVIWKNPHILPELLSPGDFLLLPNKFTYEDFYSEVLYPEMEAVQAKVDKPDNALKDRLPAPTAAPSSSMSATASASGTSVASVQNIAQSLLSMAGSNIDDVSEPLTSMASSVTKL